MLKKKQNKLWRTINLFIHVEFFFFYHKNVLGGSRCKKKCYDSTVQPVTSLTPSLPELKVIADTLRLIFLKHTGPITWGISCHFIFSSRVELRTRKVRGKRKSPWHPQLKGVLWVLRRCILNTLTTLESLNNYTTFDFCAPVNSTLRFKRQNSLTKTHAISFSSRKQGTNWLFQIGYIFAI